MIDKEIIISVITKEVACDAIIIYGSHGRGEGAFLENGNCLLAYNDYDIAIVSDRNTGDIKAMEDLLKERLGIEWVDLSVLRKSTLKSLKASVYNYDLKYHSEVIYGDPNVLHLIPPIDPADIGIRDVEKLFYTRSWYFLNFDKLNWSNDIVFHKYQIAKALFAVIDAKCIIKKSYTGLYHEKIRRYKMLYNDDNFLTKDLLRELYIIKLRPNSENALKNWGEKEFYYCMEYFYYNFMDCLSLLSKASIQSVWDLYVFRRNIWNWDSIEFRRRLRVFINPSKDFSKIRIVEALLLEYYVRRNEDLEWIIEKSNLLLGLNCHTLEQVVKYVNSNSR